jgi:hypothetical protein
MKEFIIFMIYLCHLIWHVDTVTDVYFFERDLESRELRFSHDDISNTCSGKKAAACLYPPTFSPSTNLSQIYQVLEYQDYLNLNNRELILKKANNSSFTIIDSRNQVWYLVYKGEPKLLKEASDELENLQLSIFYYTDVFFDIPDAHLYATIATILATMAAAFSTVFSAFSILQKYIYRYDGRYDTSYGFACSLNDWYLPLVLWMLFSTILSGTKLGRLITVESKMDGSMIALISTMANWGSTGFIIWTAIYKAKSTILNFCLLILALIMSFVPVIIYVFYANVFGQDDASLLTGYSYINTVTTSFDRIQLM